MLRIATPLLSRRGRRIAAVGAALAALAAVIAGNQPDDGLHLPAVAAAASPSPASTARVAVRAAAEPTPSGLRLLHRTVALHGSGAPADAAPVPSAAAGILFDADTGELLWQRDADTPRPPASTTKVLSALVALQNLDPARRVDITADALTQGADETRLGMEAGDHYTVTEMLQAMMLVSANDAATAMAVDTVGLDRFVRAMNEQVAALGLHESHFTNPVGMDDAGEMVSPHDLAVIGLAAWESSPLLRQIVATADLDVPATDGHIAYHLHNLDRLLQTYAGAALGIKPGYTGNAGYCLVMMAQRDGHRLVGVLMDDPRLYAESRALLEWGFAREGVAPIATPTPTAAPTPHR